MPNVEIHGLGWSEAQALRIEIFKLFAKKSYIDDMVVSICLTSVRDKDGKEQPFIRLVNSCQEHTEEILAGLKTLNMDIEQLSLVAFFQAEKTKKGPT